MVDKPARLAMVVCVAVSVMATRAIADDSGTSALAAQDVLERMKAAYAGCKSYSGTGVVTTVYLEDDGRTRTTEKPFATAFLRPGRFRFEFTNRSLRGDELRYIVWRDGAQVRSWWDLHKQLWRSESLVDALGTAAGVSERASMTVPALLVPAEFPGRPLTAFAETKRIEDGVLCDVECFRIEGRFVGHPMTVWIDKSTFLLRRIDLEWQFPDFRTMTTTLYEPVIDQTVAADALAFNAPGGDSSRKD